MSTPATDPTDPRIQAKSREIGYPRGQIAALIGHAECARAGGNLALASLQARDALALSSVTGMRIRNGQARAVLAHVELDLGDIGSAKLHAKSAVQIGRDTGAQLDHARALSLLGLVHRATGDREAAQECRQQALSLLAMPQPPQVADLARLLASEVGR